MFVLYFCFWVLITLLTYCWIWIKQLNSFLGWWSFTSNVKQESFLQLCMYLFCQKWGCKCLVFQCCILWKRSILLISNGRFFFWIWRFSLQLCSSTQPKWNKGSPSYIRQGSRRREEESENAFQQVRGFTQTSIV